MRRKSTALGLTAESASDSLADSMFQQQLVVLVNGAEHEIPPETSVGGLLAQLGFGGKRIAVAVNRSVVPRSAFDTQKLAAGDRIEILEAVGGG
jgi:sulfur carrier protein